MTPAQARAMYRRQMSAGGSTQGEMIVLRRQPSTDSQPILARVTGYAPQELVGGITQGNRKVIALAEDVEAAVTAGWPGPIVKTDRVILTGGKSLAITAVDDSTRRIGGVLIAYEFTVAGA